MTMPDRRLCDHHRESLRLAARHLDPDTLDRLAADPRRACPECQED